MAYTSTGINTSATIVRPAGAEMTDAIGKAVKFDASGNVVLASTAGEAAIGIVLLTNADTIKKGEDVDVQIKEIGKAKVGAAVSAGAELAVEADGTLITATAGQYVVATALDAATKAGQIINVQITKYQKKTA